MKLKSNFAIFILTHGRPECLTAQTLKDVKYSGKLYFILDDADSTKAEYEKNYGKDRVITFHKQDYLSRVDRQTNKPILNTVLYTRQAVFDIAKDLHVDYFMCLDDDIKAFYARSVIDNKLKKYKISDICPILYAMEEYMETAPISILGIACARTYFGGKDGTYKERVRFDFTVAYMCCTDRPIQFNSVCYEDANASIYNQRDGKVCFEILDVCEDSIPTGTNMSGGMNEFYQQNAYERAMYDVLSFPDCLRVNGKYLLNYRRKEMVPMIISGSFKKWD